MMYGKWTKEKRQVIAEPGAFRKKKKLAPYLNRSSQSEIFSIHVGIEIVCKGFYALNALNLGWHPEEDVLVGAATIQFN